MKRRTILQAAAAAPLLATPGLPRAQEFTQPVRIVVPYAPGGTSDILARLIAPSAGPRASARPWWSRTGPAPAATSAPTAVAKSRPDGHTMLLLDVSVLATNPHPVPAPALRQPSATWRRCRW